MLRLQFIGNITKDAEVRVAGNAKVISFSVAVNEQWKDRNGEKQSKTTYIDCAKWVSADGSTALSQYLTKGKLVYVEGEPSVNAYANNQGEVVGRLNVKVADLQLLGGNGSRTEGETSAPAQQTRTTPNTVVASIPPPVNAAFASDEDLPF